MRMIKHTDPFSELGRLPASALAVALDCVATPTFLLDPDGRIVYANNAGDEFLRCAKALRRLHSRLVPRRAKEAKALAAVLAQVGQSHHPELVRLLSRDGAVSLIMTITPVPSETLMVACVADLQADREPLANW